MFGIVIWIAFWLLGTLALHLTGFDLGGACKYSCIVGLCGWIIFIVIDAHRQMNCVPTFTEILIRKYIASRRI